MHSSNKVPQVTLAFWIIKILATTLGETGGDAVSMSLQLGYAMSTIIFLGFFAVTLAGQVAANKYHAWLYWTVIVATTTAGTTLSDYLDRTLALGYPKASLLLFGLVLLSLLAWKLVVGSVAVNNITTRKAEIFYWVTIFFSNTLGTALGDFTSDSSGLGYEGAALVFAGGLAVITLAYFFTKIPRSLLFWAAFILTRPLGAALGDLLTKAHDKGGFALDRATSSLVIAVVMAAGIFLTMRRPKETA